MPQILNRPNDPTKIEDHFKIRISLHEREDPSQNTRSLEGETKDLLNVYLSSAKRMPGGNPRSVFSTSGVTCLVFTNCVNSMGRWTFRKCGGAGLLQLLQPFILGLPPYSRLPWVNKRPHWYCGENPKIHLNYFDILPISLS